MDSPRTWPVLRITRTIITAAPTIPIQNNSKYLSLRWRSIVMGSDVPPRPVWRDPVKSLHDAMLDPQLFGRTFGGPTFEHWRVIAKALDGSPLKPGELAFFRAVSGRDVAPGKPTPEAYLIKPRRAGGTLFAAAVALHAPFRTIATSSDRASSPPSR